MNAVQEAIIRGTLARMLDDEVADAVGAELLDLLGTYERSLTR